MGWTQFWMAYMADRLDCIRIDVFPKRKTNLIVTDMIKALVGNGSVNTFPQTYNNGNCVLCGPLYS